MGPEMNEDEYIDLTLQVTRNSLDAAKGYVTAAELGANLRQAGGGPIWEQFGFRTLSRFLQKLEVQKRIEVVQSDGGALAVRPLEVNPATLNVAVGVYNPLRKPVWSAFIMGGPAGRRFIHRTHGSVRLGLVTSPSPVDEWAEIIPVAEDVQQSWARDFIASENLSDYADVVAAVSAPHWHRAFPDALDTVARGLRGRWNSRRSREVSKAAEAWAVEQGVALDFVFQAADAPVGAAQEFSMGTHLSVPVTTPARDTSALQREWILAAVAKLPLERLLEISLPTGLLLDVIAAHPHGTRG
jgi:hypothetical protein